MITDAVFQELKSSILADEGVRDHIYNDHLGNPTFGIGHLITKDDPEYGEPIGTSVDLERVDNAFEEDLECTIDDCYKLYSGKRSRYDTLPWQVQVIVGNMIFNMGRPRLTKFKLMKAAVLKKDWAEAAVQMEDSAWFRQVPNRAKRLVALMNSI